MRYSNGFSIGWRNRQAPMPPGKRSDDSDA
jgi:hypothetical protein